MKYGAHLIIQNKQQSANEVEIVMLTPTLGFVVKNVLKYVKSVNSCDTEDVSILSKYIL